MKISKNFLFKSVNFTRYGALNFSTWTLGLARRHWCQAPFYIDFDHILSSHFGLSFISFETAIELPWTFSGSSPDLFHISWVCGAGILDIFAQWNALITCFPPCDGDVNLTAVPSGTTWWWPCLHKPDFKSLYVPEVYWPQFQAPVTKQLLTCQSHCQMAEVFGLGSTTCGWCPGVVSRMRPAESSGAVWTLPSASCLYNHVWVWLWTFPLNIFLA